MAYSDSTGAAVRQANAIAVVESLRDALVEHDGDLTVTAVADRTELSRPTVEAVIADLVERSVVRVGAPNSGSRGRPARRVSLAAEQGCVAGIDIGAGTVRIRLVDLAGRELHQSTRSVPRRPKAGDREAVLHDQLRAAVTAAGMTLSRLRAVGLAVPGVIDDSGRLTASQITPEWVGASLGPLLRRRWRCPVSLENDIKLAALAEHKVGAAQSDDIAYWSLGHRLSLASIVGGTLLQGHHRLAGELTTMHEMEWTSTSVGATLRWTSRPDGRAVFEAAAAGAADARAEVERFCTEVAPLMAVVTLTTDPELLVIGGGLSRAGATLLEPLQRALHARLDVESKPRLVASHLGVSASVTGALGLAFEHSSAEILGLDGVAPPWSTWQPRPVQQPTQERGTS